MIRFLLLFLVLNSVIYWLGWKLSESHRNRSRRQDSKSKEYISRCNTNFTVINIALAVFVLGFGNSWLNWSADMFSIVNDFILMLLIYDVWMYWTHRSILHRTPVVRENVHLKHHNQHVIPSDWLHVHWLELAAQTFGFVVPTLLCKINAFSFLLFAVFKQCFEV